MTTVETTGENPGVVVIKAGIRGGRTGSYVHRSVTGRLVTGGTAPVGLVDLMRRSRRTRVGGGMVGLEMRVGESGDDEGTGLAVGDGARTDGPKLGALPRETEERRRVGCRKR